MIEDCKTAHVSNFAQYCSIVQTGAGNVKLFIGGEWVKWLNNDVVHKYDTKANKQARLNLMHQVVALAVLLIVPLLPITFGTGLRWNYVELETALPPEDDEHSSLRFKR